MLALRRGGASLLLQVRRAVFVGLFCGAETLATGDGWDCSAGLGAGRIDWLANRSLTRLAMRLLPPSDCLHGQAAARGGGASSAGLLQRGGSAAAGKRLMVAAQVSKQAHRQAMA